MKWFSGLVLILVVFGQCVINTRQSQRCPPVRLANGRVRTRGRGRIIRFSCYNDFILIGNKYSTCVRGQWDTPTPVCVNENCPALATPEHALVKTKYNGAILIYFCEPGYDLIGAAEIYCDGKQWNSTSPTCRNSNMTAPTSCDFEKPDLCWWEQDPQHDFDWRRQNFETPSSHIGTGPTHDHTLGPGKDGYYIYIEASGRLENDTARIISPLYNSSYTNSGCFSFWYHMFGGTVGGLNVYFQPENSKSRIMFSRAGDQGNRWLHGIFPLPTTNLSFQIIIEGIRGSSYVSDIAVDDVAILQGDECMMKTKTNNETVTVTESNDDQIELVNAQQSCRGRCGNTTTENYTTIIPITSPDACHCTSYCAENSTCCPDYAAYCVLVDEISGSSDIDVTEESTLITELGTKSVHVPITNLPYPKDEIDPDGSEPPPITHLPYTSITTMRSPSKAPIVTAHPETRETPYRYKTTPSHFEETNMPADAVEVTRNVTPDISITGIIALAIGVLTGIALTMTMAFIIVRRKRSSYKRGSNGSALSEDSDVRFLTSDEILDFHLARPTDHDET